MGAIWPFGPSICALRYKAFRWRDADPGAPATLAGTISEEENSERIDHFLAAAAPSSMSPSRARIPRGLGFRSRGGQIVSIEPVLWLKAPG